MMRKVCVVTGSRAEYGLLRPLLFRLKNDEEIFLQLVVTGSHLSETFGNTQKEIEDDGFDIYARVEFPLEGDSKVQMAKSAGNALITFASYFEENRPDLVVVLGDRYEIFSACTAATILGIAIAHISGGDVTQGTLYDAFRHCITKMSLLHFTGCEQSAKRVVQLGENPKYVFNVGETGVENCFSIPLISIEELQKNIDIDIMEKPFSIVTFHPATLDDNCAENQTLELVKALEKFDYMNFIITKANADAGGRFINEIWDRQKINHKNWLVVSSLGVVCYLSAMKYAKMVIGNSSSGLVEAPAMKKPTVNIGDRQKGRMIADSVICCNPNEKDIVSAMNKAMSHEFQIALNNTVNPFGDGNSSWQIYNVIRKYLNDNHFNNKKEFYDIR